VLRGKMLQLRVQCLSLTDIHRERGRKRDTDRQTETDRQRHRQRQIHKTENISVRLETNLEANELKYRRRILKNIKRKHQTKIWKVRHIGKQTNRQTNTQIYRKTKPKHDQPST
jgi:hypothetical protein